MEKFIVIVGKFGDLGCDTRRFIEELRLAIPQSIFPWENQQLVFHPARSDFEYWFDIPMREIAKGYENPPNPGGLRSLLEVTYNFDTFTSINLDPAKTEIQEGLYGKVLLEISESLGLRDLGLMAEKIFLLLKNHRPIKPGQKIRGLDMSPKVEVSEEIPEEVKDRWVKINVDLDNSGEITQHIFVGKRGETKKVHLFRRSKRGLEYEESSSHLSPEQAKLSEMGGTIVQDGIVHPIKVSRRNVIPSKRKPQKLSH